MTSTSRSAIRTPDTSGPASSDPEDETKDRPKVNSKAKECETVDSVVDNEDCDIV